MVSTCSRVWLRVAAVSLIAAAAAGCTDSGRFDNTIFSSRRSAPAETTGSIAPRTHTARIESQPLPAPGRPETVASNGGVAQGGQGLGAYRPSADITGSVPEHRAPAPTGHWTWEGGTPVTVGHGETVEIVARKYGVPIAAIMQANNISSANDVRPGQRLVIPRYTVAAESAQMAPAPVVAAPRVSAPVAAPVKSAASVHVVQPGESLIGLSRHYHVPLNVLAKANNMVVYAKVNMGDRIKIPAGYGVAAEQVASAAPRAETSRAEAPRIEPPRAAAPQVAATAPATQTARMATPEPVKEEPVTKSAEATGALPSFRWPVKGRVIAAFGPKPNGQQNDGINLAVPEGTPVKAAEDGVVAYAGNELKGYGNLILVRHANGFVSAYANTSEILVKRGDTIKRGQVIAHAGQTGNVTSPQLHFEIRKGSTPVDPTQYLGSQG
jgi:murein DD-endopeptidase MepM/ murein hydrolase activator NlpD